MEWQNRYDASPSPNREVFKMAAATNGSVTLVQSAASQTVQWQTSELAVEQRESTITVNPRDRYQTMIGFGGAFTEASAFTLSRIPAENRAQVIQAYYSRTDGLGYSIGRIPIHSCDFSLGNYTYVDENDASLSSFSLDHEDEYLFPLIRDAEAERGEPIPLLASPWSPPPWMKDTGAMNNGGKLLPEHRATWSAYLVRYIREMRARGFDLWALTVQNEPAAVQTWDSCIYSAEEERDFVRDHLGPALHSAGLADVRLLVWDHNRDIMVDRARTVLQDERAAQYVWGVGFHWYVSEEFENVGEVHRLFPEKHLLFTEGCQEGGTHLGSWVTGARYARNMIGDFRNWCEGYLDWNIVLDETGGPNHVGNLCDAPIIADTRTGGLHYNSSYYAIGHFSRYVAPGSVRIGVTGDTRLGAVAFENPDGSIVVVLQNETDEEVPFAIAGDGSGTAAGTLSANAIGTVIWG